MLPSHVDEGMGTYGGDTSSGGSAVGGGTRTDATGRYGGENGSGAKGGIGGDAGGRADTQTHSLSIGHPDPSAAPYAYCSVTSRLFTKHPEALYEPKRRVNV